MSENTDKLISELIVAAREFALNVSLGAAKREKDAGDALRAELAASQAEVEELKEIIYKVIAYCASGRVVRLGEIEAFTPEINVEDVKKWQKAIEGGAQ